jgi:hypothetical protein
MLTLGAFDALEQSAVSSPDEAPPIPPPMAAALEELRRVLVGPDGKPIDPLTAGWDQIEKGIILLLGGAFNPQQQRHLDVAFMLAAALAERLRRDLGAFWFQNRATPHGATLGFPDAVVVFSPIEAVFEALGRAKLGMLDSLAGELSKAVAQGRGAGERPGLGPEEYQRLFDPGLAQFLALDPDAVGRALSTPTESTARDFEHGFSRMSREIPEQARKQVAAEIGGALRRLPGATALGDQIPQAPQLVEFVAMATGALATTGIAPVEFWEQLLIPLLHIGAADNFAPLEDEELAAYRQGADPLLLYVDVMPYRTPAADEDGVLGVFPHDQVTLLDGRFAGGQGVRLVKLDLTVLAPLCAAFDPAAVRASVEKFAALCAETAGGAVPQPPSESGRPNLREVVLLLAENLKHLVALAQEKGLWLVLRHATESEAGSEPILQELRRALREPRIVLA